MTPPRLAGLRPVELAGALLVLAGFVRVVIQFFDQGYLGPPFVFDIGDTFMDWFNTAYWAHKGDAYGVWRTIYLPLSFVVTRLMGDPRCYNAAPYDARECDWFGIVFILAMYVGSIVVSTIAFYRRDRSTALYRSLAIAIGGPLLFALERGQIIMLTYIAMVALYGNLVRGRANYALTAAFMANTKVYMVLPIFSLAIKRDWRLFELCAIGSLGLYLVTLAITNEGTPIELISNLQNWFSVRLGTIWDEVLYTTTYKPLLQLDVQQYPVRDYIEQRYVDAAVVFINQYSIWSRGIALLCVGLAWLYPKAITTSRLVFFILMQSFVSQNPGGYGIALIVFLVFLEKSRNKATLTAIICAYLISVPGDWTLANLISVERQSWLSGRLVMSDYVVPFGALIRPGIIAIMLWALAFDSLRNFHRAARAGPPTFGLAKRRDRAASPASSETREVAA